MHVKITLIVHCKSLEDSTHQKEGKLLSGRSAELLLKVQNSLTQHLRVGLVGVCEQDRGDQRLREDLAEVVLQLCPIWRAAAKVLHSEDGYENEAKNGLTPAWSADRRSAHCAPTQPSTARTGSHSRLRSACRREAQRRSEPQRCAKELAPRRKNLAAKRSKRLPVEVDTTMKMHSLMEEHCREEPTFGGQC